jgi:hypothetical protein
MVGTRGLRGSRRGKRRRLHSISHSIEYLYGRKPTVRSVASFVAHKCEVALVGLNYRRRFKIILVELVDHFVESRDVIVVRCKIHIATFFAVAIRVECIRPTVLVISEQAEILRPVTERLGRIHEAIRPSDVVRLRKALQQPAVRRIICMPPHLREVSIRQQEY